MKKNFWVIGVLLIFLAGCGGEAAPTPAAIATEPPLPEIAAEAEVAPTDTAVPVQPTNTRPPTPTAVPPPNMPTPPDIPALVWLPYATGNFGEPVLMLEDDEMALRPLPVEVEIFFDYKAGWLAYGSEFWGATDDQQSVTNLHIYNFATDTDQLWAEGNIGRAAISPTSELSNQPVVAATVHNGSGFDLVIQLGPDNSIPLVEDIDPYFSWSPDSRQIAYLRDHELFVTDSVENSGNPPIASGVYQNSQWIGDAPLWLGESGYLLYADNPFTIVAIDGSEKIVPLTEAGTALQGGRPFAMLYSSTHNQLIAESEGMFGTNVTIYQFRDGFRTAVLAQQIDDAQLAGWDEENESVVIVSGGEPTVLPLTPPE